MELCCREPDFVNGAPCFQNREEIFGARRPD